MKNKIENGFGSSLDDLYFVALVLFVKDCRRLDGSF
jgi:hypothetical protein